MDPLLKTILSPTYQAPTNPAIIRETLINLARYSRALEIAVPPDAMAEPRATAPSVHPSPPTSSTNESPEPERPVLDFHAVRPPRTVADTDHPPTSCDELSALADNLKRSISLTDSQDRFFGSSSSVAYLQAAVVMGGTDGPPFKGAHPPLEVRPHLRPEFWSVHPVGTSFLARCII